nr:retrovirus-related Pol polyprotein from transposon TNT 1-94 [Tanacetum cinerariifolium]
MHDELEMTMMRELNFFLGLQIKQIEDEIFFNQSKYIKEMLNKFGLEDSKSAKTSMSTEIKLSKDDDADSMDSIEYQETNLAISITIDEYVSSRKACQQALWMKQALIDYDIRLDDERLHSSILWCPKEGGAYTEEEHLQNVLLYTLQSSRLFRQISLVTAPLQHFLFRQKEGEEM